MSDLIPGILEVLERLDAAGIPYAVGSNGSDRKMEITLGQHQGMITWPGDLPRLPPAARRHELRATRNRPATPAAPVEPSEDPPSEITADPDGGRRTRRWPLILASALLAIAAAGGAFYAVWPEGRSTLAVTPEPDVALETCTRAALLAGGPSYREAMEAMAAALKFPVLLFAHLVASSNTVTASRQKGRSAAILLLFFRCS